MHSKAVRKPLVAVILNILSTMFYVLEEINWRWCRHNAVPLSHISITVIDGVSLSTKGGGGEAGSPPPLNPSLALTSHIRTVDFSGRFVMGTMASQAEIGL